MGIHRVLRRRALVLLASAAVVAASVVAASVVAAPAAEAATHAYTLPKTGSVTVTSNGCAGCGYGMSQWGAEGYASVKGTTAAKIVAFYYPGTKLTPIASSTKIRVHITDAGNDTCVQAVPKMTVTGVLAAALSSSHALRYRLAPDTAKGATGLMLQANKQNRCGGTWTTIKAGLPARVDIAAPSGTVRNYHPDASSTVFRGTVGAVRQGTGELTINRVGLDAYTEGVTPRESPAWWHTAAIHAQAIAARTYADYERLHPMSSAYDICDTSQCQVYGGMTEYSPSGSVQWTDDPAAINAYQFQVLTYQRAVAFTQYSASDGGYTVSGGRAYLSAHADPYDTAANGDWYMGVTRKTSVSAIAKAFGLATVTKIVTTRDGHGAWGGRVLSAKVTGYKTAAAAKAQKALTTVSTSGLGLQNALGAQGTLFTITS